MLYIGSIQNKMACIKDSVLAAGLSFLKENSSSIPANHIIITGFKADAYTNVFGDSMRTLYQYGQITCIRKIEKDMVH